MSIVRQWYGAEIGSDTSTSDLSGTLGTLPTAPKGNELISFRGSDGATVYAIRISHERQRLYCTACDWTRAFQYGERVSFRHESHGFCTVDPITVRIAEPVVRVKLAEYVEEDDDE